MKGPSVIVASVRGGPGLERLLDSLSAQTAPHELVVIDNGSAGAAVSAACAAQAEVIRLDENAGYSRAVNLGVEAATGDTIVLLNDDCVCDPQFVELICAALDPRSGLVMAAGVMRDPREPELIDSAGMELDSTLLPLDYLNGEPTAILDRGVPVPVGPSAAAAAFDRDAWGEAGGFDEALFAYWEDVDLVLRLRQLGGRCALAAGARGAHEHSATLGSGSRAKNYLMGYGRGYVLRKWGVLAPRRLPAVFARDVPTLVGQALFDRNAAGVRGRVRGWRASRRAGDYPSHLIEGTPQRGAASTLARRASRRARIRRSGESP